MYDQTPVQIAWVTGDLAATEAALTSLLGAWKWIRMPAVPFSEFACLPAEIRAFFDPVKQEQD